MTQPSVDHREHILPLLPASVEPPTMFLEEKKSIHDFQVIGINFRNCNATLRSAFALNERKYTALLKNAATFGIHELFVLSTCNRTEIYGFTRDAFRLSSLLCQYTDGDHDAFLQQAYVHKSHAALAHLYQVAAGLDAQILGDYEIVGQLKHAVNLAKDKGRIGPFTDRLFKSVLQSCRAIRSETKLSNGSVSVAHAAVQFLKQAAPDYKKKNILLIGTGKIGTNTGKNLIGEIPPEHLTVMNRTNEKADRLALSLSVKAAPYQELKTQVDQADIVLVATNAPKPVINEQVIPANVEKILIDLSIPNNIAPTLKQFPGIRLSNIDDLSRVSEETLRRREKEVPRAKALINYYIHDFAEWYLMRQHVPVLKAVKQKLSELNEQLSDIQPQGKPEAIQRVLNAMAVKMKNAEQKPGCYYIEAITDYMNEAIEETSSCPAGN